MRYKVKHKLSDGADSRPDIDIPAPSPKHYKYRQFFNKSSSKQQCPSVYRNLINQSRNLSRNDSKSSRDSYNSERSVSPSSPDAPESTVYIRGLPNDTLHAELENAFQKYGPIRTVYVERSPPISAFVEFDDSRDAEDAARAMDGARICGVEVQVEMYNKNCTLEDAFYKYGQIYRIWFDRCPHGVFSPSAFVEFYNAEDAEEAVRAMNGGRICGVKVRVEEYTGEMSNDEVDERVSQASVISLEDEELEEEEGDGGESQKDEDNSRAGDTPVNNGTPESVAVEANDETLMEDNTGTVDNAFPPSQAINGTANPADSYGMLNIFGLFRESMDNSIKLLNRNIEKRDEEMVARIRQEFDRKLKEKDAEIAKKNSEIAKKNSEIAKKNSEIAKKNTEIAKKNTEIANKNTEIVNNNRQISEQTTEITSIRAENARLRGEVQQANRAKAQVINFLRGETNSLH